MPTEIGAAYLLLVTLSVMCVMFTGNEHGEWWGIAMCLGSVLMQSAQMSLSGRLMSGKLDSFQLNFYTGPVAFSTLMLMECAMQREMRGLYRFAVKKPEATTGIVLGGCVLADSEGEGVEVVGLTGFGGVCGGGGCGTMPGANA